MAARRYKWVFLHCYPRVAVGGTTVRRGKKRRSVSPTLPMPRPAIVASGAPSMLAGAPVVAAGAVARLVLGSAVAAGLIAGAAEAQVWGTDKAPTVAARPTPADTAATPSPAEPGAPSAPEASAPVSPDPDAAVLAALTTGIKFFI